MNILYYTWNEYCNLDIRQCFEALGYEYTVFDYELKNKLQDEPFSLTFMQVLEEGNYDCIFSFNYFPIIATVAKKRRIKYISWIFDCPQLSLYTDSVFSKYNYIFHFDRSEVVRLKGFGADHVFHMPLAVNTDRLQQIQWQDDLQYDVSFIGNLYQNEFNFFDQIKHMPEYYRGYFDALIQSQMKLFGYNLISEILTPEEFQKISSFVSFQNDGELFLDNRTLFIELILEKKVTTIERVELLKSVSKHFHTTLFSNANDTSLEYVDFKGYVDYMTQMPHIFHNSRINLNMTLRSIHSGIPLRCMDIIGSGGLLLSNYQPELAEFFKNDEEVLMYESKEDLLYKINYYLSHEEERRNIAHAGMEKVRKEFDYKVSMEKIMKLAFA